MHFIMLQATFILVFGNTVTFGILCITYTMLGRLFTSGYCVHILLYVTLHSYVYTYIPNVNRTLPFIHLNNLSELEIICRTRRRNYPISMISQ